jgi:hypothetical protein
VHLVERYNERRFPVSEQSERFESLRFQSMLRNRLSDKVLGLLRQRTIMSTTKIAMLQRELPRDRKFVNDSCPGVSMMSRPGILYSAVPSYVPSK